MDLEDENMIFYQNIYFFTGHRRGRLGPDHARPSQRGLRLHVQQRGSDGRILPRIRLLPRPRVLRPRHPLRIPVLLVLRFRYRHHPGRHLQVRGHLRPKHAKVRGGRAGPGRGRDILPLVEDNHLTSDAHGHLHTVDQ